MRISECLIFYTRFLLITAVCGLLLVSCSSQSKQKHLDRGEEYLQKRKFHEALMEFRAASEIDKTSSKAHWGLARAHENLGQMSETVDHLRKAVELDAKNLDAKAKLGNYYLLFNPPLIGETEKLINEIFSMDENFIEGHILKASLLAIQNKPEPEVLAVINHAISLAPNRTESYISLARYFIKRQKISEAESAMQKAIAANPNAALGYVEYGRFLTYVNRSDESEAQFLKAVTVEPNSIEAREAIAQFYLVQRQIEKAEQAYKDLAQIQENSPESRMALADFYATVGREEEAIQVFTQILTDAPEYARARYRLAEIYLDRRELDKVSAEVEKLLAANDTDVEALMLRARARMQENKTEEAVKDLESILKKQPSQKNALFYMAQARLALGQTDQARAFAGDLDKYHSSFLRTRLLKIQIGFSEGMPDAALREANQLLEAIKNTVPNAEMTAQSLEDLRVRAISARGLAKLSLGKIAEARVDLQEIVRLSPNSSAALVNFARVSIAENNLSEAQNLYEKALNADAKSFEALNGLVSVLNRQGNFAAAHQRIEQAIQASQADTLPALHYLKSEVLTAEKNIAAAEDELKKAIDLDENYLPAYSAYAALLIDKNQIDEAIKQYEKVVELKPSASIYTLLGILEEGRDNFGLAEKHYRKSLEIAPKTPIASNNLAWLIAEYNQGNLDEALQLAQTAVNRQMNASNFHDTLGWVYFKKGLYSPAVEQLKKAVALNEAEAQKNGQAANPAYRVRLGIALASAGDKQNARKEVALALENEGNLSRKDLHEARILLASL